MTTLADTHCLSLSLKPAKRCTQQFTSLIIGVVVVGLATGTRLGAFEILGPLGAGGMGEVYRARDTKLNRDVALKILPESLAEDADTIARFRREAHLLAALNHPHIAAIYGIEETVSPTAQPSVGALVLELVDGETLAERLKRGPLPRDEALVFAGQIANALAAAHEQGIIHRDLKPANIQITEAGVVKVLDFGLAKAATTDGVSTAGSQSPTITTQGTRAGVILGTAAYMSPEQAKGRPVDRRSDLWAFGVVLYEMLAGRRAFDGEDVTEILAHILTKEPDWRALPANTPVPIRTLLRRCLQKDRARRLDSATSAQLEIEDTLGHSNTVAEPAEGRRMVAVAAMFAALIAGAALAALAMKYLTTRSTVSPPTAVQRYTIVPPSAQPIAVLGFRRSIAISPDGRYLAYLGGSGSQSGPLMVRRLDSLESNPVPGVTAMEVAFSPDSEWIAFFEQTSTMDIKKVPLGGGAVVTVARDVGIAADLSWSDDDSIIYSSLDPDTGLLRVSANGGAPSPLTKPDTAQHERDHTSPAVLPGGRGVLFEIALEGGGAEIAVLDQRTGRYKKLLRGITPQYVEVDDGAVRAGYLLFASEGTLRTVRFDRERLELVGEPVTLAEQVYEIPTRRANYMVSQSGTLIYMPATAAIFPTRSLVWVDRQGSVRPIKGLPIRAYNAPRISPDGKSVAFVIGERESSISTWDFASEILTRVTFGPGVDNVPIWSRDGRAIVFGSTRAGRVFNLYRQAIDGSGAAERLTTSGIQQFASDILPDGSRVVGTEFQSKYQAVVLFPSAATDGAASETILPNAQNASLSPNGRFLAYEAIASGGAEIYVRPFPRLDGGRWLVSTAGGRSVRWSRDGRELFYLDRSDAMMAATTQTSAATFSAGAPVRLFDASFARSDDILSFDVSLDGQRFLMTKREPRPGAAPQATIVVVTNCFDEIKARQ